MRLLLQVKGVVSITFDMNKKRCIVRTKLDVRPEVLIHTLYVHFHFRKVGCLFMFSPNVLQQRLFTEF